MLTKSKNIIFISGIFTGIIFTAIAFGSGIVSYHLTRRSLNLLQTRIDETNSSRFVELSSNFNISFESPDDLNIFETQQAGAEISHDFATEGKHSLLVEFPAARTYPGITFDLFGKYCLNWENMKSFSFDVLNTIERKAVLIIQIRSGERYPKRQFKKEFTLSALTPTTITIERNELETKLDLDKISHLTIFMNSPPTTFKMYFDNMKVNRQDT